MFCTLYIIIKQFYNVVIKYTIIWIKKGKKERKERKGIKKGKNNYCLIFNNLSCVYFVYSLHTCFFLLQE
jgi:uncharacterized OsmC-like protein